VKRPYPMDMALWDLEPSLRRRVSQTYREIMERPASSDKRPRSTCTHHCRLLRTDIG